jgi:hypothetical protein
MSDESTTIPADLVPYVALGLRVALSELRARAEMQREELASEDAKKIPKAIRMGIEGSANQADELRHEMIRAYRNLPDSLRPRDDLMADRVPCVVDGCKAYGLGTSLCSEHARELAEHPERFA